MKRTMTVITLILMLTIVVGLLIQVAGAGYSTAVYKDEGGDRIVVADGGEIQVESGGTIDIQNGAAVNLVDMMFTGIGNIYYVNSNVTTEGDGTSWTDAKDTIDEGINLCSANDFIYLAQGHAETKSVAGALFTADVEDVTIIAMGTGDNRPKLTLSHTGAKIDITANNVRISNIYVDATGVDSVNTPINVSGEGVVLNRIYMRLADTNGQADVGITVGIADGDANDLVIANSQFIAPDAGAASAITFAKDMENVLLSNLKMYGDFSTTPLEVPSGGNAQVNLRIEHCTIVSKNADEPAIEINGTGNTGSIINCVLVSDVEATILDAGGLSVSADTQLIVIGNAEGAALPANTTLVDLLGDYTGPDSGTAADDNIKAHLDLILADTEAMDTSAELVALIDSEIGDKVVADMDANSILADLAGISEIGDKVTADMDANSLLVNWTSARAAILTDLAGISEIGDKVVADMDANSTLVDILTDTAAMDTAAELSILVDPNKVTYDAPRIISDLTGNFNGADYETGDSPVTIFTVTGDILARMVAIVNTNCTSTSTNGTLEAGVVGDTACLLLQDVVDGIAFQQNDCWTLTQVPETPSAEKDAQWVMIPNGLDIDVVIGVNNMTAGVIEFYLEWIPLSADAAVVGAAP